MALWPSAVIHLAGQSAPGSCSCVQSHNPSPFRHQCFFSSSRPLLHVQEECDVFPTSMTCLSAGWSKGHLAFGWVCRLQGTTIVVSGCPPELCWIVIL